MLIRTHLAVSVFVILMLLDLIENKFIFILIVIVSTFIPDIDTRFSKLGKKKIFRPLQIFVKHRGVFHSFSFAIVLFIIFYFFVHEIAFGFLIGYGLHLVLDGFSQEGIYLLWPWKKRFRSFIKTGGLIELILFLVFLVVDVAFISFKFV